jgi:hypothetical protein
MSDYWNGSAPANPTAELLALVLARRREWAEHHVTAAIETATHDGMTWDQIAVGLARLMVDPKASPRDLVQDAPSPLDRKRDPAVAREGAAAARELLDLMRRTA